MKVGIRVFPKDVMEFATSKRQFSPKHQLRKKGVIYEKYRNDGKNSLWSKSMTLWQRSSDDDRYFATLQAVDYILFRQRSLHFYDYTNQLTWMCCMRNVTLADNYKITYFANKPFKFCNRKFFGKIPKLMGLHPKNKTSEFVLDQQSITAKKGVHFCVDNEIEAVAALFSMAIFVIFL